MSCSHLMLLQWPGIHLEAAEPVAWPLLLPVPASAYPKTCSVMGGILLSLPGSELGTLLSLPEPWGLPCPPGLPPSLLPLLGSHTPDPTTWQTPRPRSPSWFCLVMPHPWLNHPHPGPSTPERGHTPVGAISPTCYSTMLSIPTRAAFQLEVVRVSPLLLPLMTALERRHHLALPMVLTLQCQAPRGVS